MSNFCSLWQFANRTQNEEIDVPYNGNHFTIQYSGARVRLDTDYGLAVEFDGLYYVAVYVATTFEARLCGMCGNYDNNPDNDFILPNGTLLGNIPNAANIFGDSYTLSSNIQ